MLDDYEMHRRMQKGWNAGKPYTICGSGSSYENTRNIVEWLPRMFGEFHIESMVDAGAGDMVWLREILSEQFEYIPCDLVPRSDEVIQVDITTNTLPTADAILCRMVLNHLAGEYDENGKRDDERTTMALELFKASGAQYLFATQFYKEDLQPNTPEFARLDLRDWLGVPLATCRDGMTRANGVPYHCYLALWKLC